MYKSFGFIGDILLMDKDEIKLGEFALCRAKGTIREELQEFANKFGVTHAFALNRFEFDRIEKKNGHSEFHKLAPDNYRYSIIKYQQTHVINRRIELIFKLSSLDLTFLFLGELTDARKKINYVRGGAYRPLNASIFFNNVHYSIAPIKLIPQNYADEIKLLTTLIDDFDLKTKDYQTINKCLSDFIDLTSISDSTPFKLLGYTTILEHLLCEDIKNISGELGLKLNLINNQLTHPINIKNIFPTSDKTFGNFIEAIYKTRNDIAHGNNIQIQKHFGNIKVDRKSIEQFLHNFVKQVLIYSLKNPQLVKDLKSCQ